MILSHDNCSLLRRPLKLVIRTLHFVIYLFYDEFHELFIQNPCFFKKKSDQDLTINFFLLQAFALLAHSIFVCFVFLYLTHLFFGSQYFVKCKMKA